MSANSSRRAARMWSCALVSPGMQPYVSLTPPVRRISWWVLSTPTWTMASACTNALPTVNERYSLPRGAATVVLSSSMSMIVTPSSAQTRVMPLRW